MHAAFDRLADHILGSARAGEIVTLRLQAEQSDFVRFNRGLVRQPGSVDQRVATLRLVSGGRQATAERTLAGVDALDFAALDDALVGLRERLPLLPEDPQLNLAEGAGHTSFVAIRDLPATEQMVADILDEAGAAAVDLVGFLAAGPVYAGYASSTGQRHWFATNSFNFEWCLYLHGNVATKASYAGDRWERAALARKIAEGRRALAVLARPARVLDPGAYRAWLTPSAFTELLGLAAGWGGFSARAVRTAQSPLLGLWEGKQALSPMFSVTEDAANGVAPRFDDDGWTRPDRVSLIDAGQPGTQLVSSRSAREYGLTPNGASSDESPISVTVAAGGLAEADVLRTLDTGLWIGALWYTNWSNRYAGRATGMTRFATFWVEGGELVAPIAAMRFDDSLYRTFGTELEAVGAEPETMLSSGTYYRRSTESVHSPGILVRSFALSL